jgi:enterochelin esterase-like enzyme
MIFPVLTYLERLPSWHLGGRLGRALAMGLLMVLASGCSPIAALPLPTLSSPGDSTPTPPPSPEVVPTASPTVDCSTMPGRLADGVYRSLILREDMPFRVYLPPCYDNSHAAYPALYLLHGTPSDSSDWERMGVADLASEAIDKSEWPAFIMVMPHVPDSMYSNTDGGPNSYEAELVDGLVSFVDLAYRTDPRPQARALAGISRGGVWALEIGLRNPDVFSTVAAVSPSLAVNNPRPAYDPLAIARNLVNPPRLLLMAGDHDWARDATEQLDQLLTARDVPHQYVVFPGKHEESAWQASLKLLLASLVSGWSTQQ